MLECALAVREERSRSQDEEVGEEDEELVRREATSMEKADQSALVQSMDEYDE